jgi:hypothetical protein
MFLDHGAQPPSAVNHMRTDGLRCAECPSPQREQTPALSQPPGDRERARHPPPRGGGPRVRGQSPTWNAAILAATCHAQTDRLGVMMHAQVTDLYAFRPSPASGGLAVLSDTLNAYADLSVAHLLPLADRGRQHGQQPVLSEAEGNAGVTNSAAKRQMAREARKEGEGSDPLAGRAADMLLVRRGPMGRIRRGARNTREATVPWAIGGPPCRDPHCE